MYVAVVLSVSHKGKPQPKIGISPAKHVLSETKGRKGRKVTG
jgi:hypothetical protein